MRHDELRAVMHGYFKKALAARIEQIGVKGSQSERELAPQETTQMLAQSASENYWAPWVRMARTPSCGVSARLAGQSTVLQVAVFGLLIHPSYHAGFTR